MIEFLERVEVSSTSLMKTKNEKSTKATYF